MADTKIILKIYTDGACEGNQFSKNFGGWAAIFIENYRIIKEISGAEKNTTNNIMEMTAIIRALQYIIRKKINLDKKIAIFSDSAYIINCFNQKWYVKWRKNGWKTSKGTDVLNKNMWRSLISLVERSKAELIKVKGHSSNKFNERADKLAVGAISKKKN